MAADDFSGDDFDHRVKRADNAAAAAVEDVGVDHGGADIFVAQNSGTVRMSFPSSSTWLANLCLKVWQLIDMWIPTSRTAFSTVRCRVSFCGIRLEPHNFEFLREFRWG
jgi:hypothetical protein